MNYEIKNGLRALGIDSVALKKIRRKDKKRAGIIERVSIKAGDSTLVIFSVPNDLTPKEQKVITDAKWNSDRLKNRAKNLSMAGGVYVNTHDGRRYIQGSSLKER